MKLSSLINYRNQLKRLDLSDTKNKVAMDLSHVLHTVTSQPFNLSNMIGHLELQQQKIHQDIELFQELLTNTCEQINQLIYEIEKPYFVQSYSLYETDFGNETVEDIQNRVPSLAESTVNFYRARICRYIGWQHPAMIIRPGFEPYIHDMISCDPLYLIDTSRNLIEPCLDNFNENYQNRLRIYHVQEQQPDQLLNKLPDSQFGLILVYNYFNFRPLEVIRRYLEEIFQKLRPGGTLLMTFNDCDRDKAVMLVENNYCCYTPGYLIKQLTETLGYETHFEWSDEGPSTWLELRKPGQLTSLRGGQALAKIIPK